MGFLKKSFRMDCVRTYELCQCPNIENLTLDFPMTVFNYFVVLTEVTFFIFTIIVLRISGTVLE